MRQLSKIAATLTKELRVSERIVCDGEKVVPRFRVLAPEGDWLILLPLPDEAIERQRRLRLAAAFMALKLARAFVLSSELITFDALCSYWVSRDLKVGLLHRIMRGPPVLFGGDEWLDGEGAGKDVVSLLPERETSLSAAMIGELKRVFGKGGEFEATLLQP